MDISMDSQFVVDCTFGQLYVQSNVCFPSTKSKFVDFFGHTCSWNGQFFYRRPHYRPLNSTQHTYLLSRHYKYIVICLMRFTFDQLSTWQNAYFFSCLWTKSCARCDSGMSCTPRGTCVIQVSLVLQVARVWRCDSSMSCIAGGSCVKVWFKYVVYCRWRVCEGMGCAGRWQAGHVPVTSPQDHHLPGLLQQPPENPVWGPWQVGTVLGPELDPWHSWVHQFPMFEHC